MTQVFSPASPTSQPANPAPIPVNVEAPPSLSDSELVGRMRALFAKARSHRRPTVNQWVKNYRVMRNRTWMTSRPEWMPSPEVPEMLTILPARCAIMVGATCLIGRKVPRSLAMIT